MVTERVLIVNTSEDTVEALRDALTDEGYEVAAAYARDLRFGKVQLESVIAERPDAIIYDLAPPYDENWSYFRDVFSRHPLARGIPVIVTTTNARAASGYAGPDVLELMLKPYDLEHLLSRVKKALARE